MENKLKIIFLDRNTVGPFELKDIFSKYGEYTEFNLTNDDDVASYLKDYDVVINPGEYPIAVLMTEEFFNAVD